MKKEYKTRSGVSLEIEIKKVDGNEKPYYATYKISFTNTDTHRAGINGGRVFSTPQEAIDHILISAKNIISDDFEDENWMEVKQINE